MSRHEMAGCKPHTKVIVGWDPPLQTYFVHVHDAASRREGPSVWLGGSLRELYDLDGLKRAIAPHAELTPQLAQTLYSDRDGSR